MRPDSYRNARGEQVMPLSVFSRLAPLWVLRYALPAKPHTRRRDRRIRNGTINSDNGS